MLKFAFFKFFSIIFVLSEFNVHYWPTKLFMSWWWFTWQNFWDKKMVLIFYCRVRNFFFKFAFFSFFLWIIYKVRNFLSCSVKSNHGRCSCLLLSLLVGVSFLLVHVLSLSLSLSLLIRTSAAVMWRNVTISGPHYHWVIVEMFYIINDLTGTFRNHF